MFSKVYSAGILGVEGYLVSVEADVSNGLPGFAMVGYLASEVREAQDRVRTALRNSGFLLSAKKITVNLSPADIKKEGTAFDLPIAVAVLAAFGIIEPSYLEQAMLAGELGLNGEVKGIHGTLSMVLAAREAGMKRCFLPKENVMEGLAIGDIDIIGIETVEELVCLLNNPDKIRIEVTPEVAHIHKHCQYEVDFSEVSGQMFLKRATEIAVAGMHNILYLGPAGTGKSMIAQRIPTIMPELSQQESLEISKIYSICGLLPPDLPLLFKRPFRSPHHTISPQALVGGGRYPRPGEISLASRGVLFLDEISEFQKHVIELLRQPLEEHKVTISRLQGAYEFPANMMMVAAMNPCPCGFYPDKNRCRCSEWQVRKYLNKISKPILDRIDICAESAPVTYLEISKQGRGETSSEIRKRVDKARIIQKKRYQTSGIYFNSEMRGRELLEFCRLDKQEEDFLKAVFHSMGLSARSYHKILKVARTIADLEGEVMISHTHLCEAVGYRNLENKYWGGMKRG